MRYKKQRRNLAMHGERDNVRETRQEAGKVQHSPSAFSSPQYRPPRLREVACTPCFLSSLPPSLIQRDMLLEGAYRRGLFSRCQIYHRCHRSRGPAEGTHKTRRRTMNARYFRELLSELVHMQFAEKPVSYKQSELYAVVTDVASYPKFLPFCTAVQVYSTSPFTAADGRIGKKMEAEMSVGFMSLSEKYTSDVTCTPNLSVEVSCALSAILGYTNSQLGGCVFLYYAIQEPIHSMEVPTGFYSLTSSKSRHAVVIQLYRPWGTNDGRPPNE